MKSLSKAIVGALMLAGASLSATSSASAYFDAGISFGDPDYNFDPCDYYDYYDEAPPWGLPQDYCDYPVYFEPVYFGGSWYRGPIYYRWTHGRRLFWLNGGWREDGWRGPRPGRIAWNHRGGHFRGVRPGWGFHGGHDWHGGVGHRGHDNDGGRGRDRPWNHDNDRPRPRGGWGSDRGGDRHDRGDRGGDRGDRGDRGSHWGGDGGSRHGDGGSHWGGSGDGGGGNHGGGDHGGGNHGGGNHGGGGGHHH